MRIEKPTIDKISQRANDLYLLLKAKKGFVTKTEIGAYLGVKNERTVRDIISFLATKKPIISNSAGAGYKLALTVEDLEEVEHTLKEISSRIEELQKRMQPLYKWRDLVKFKIKE